MAHADELKEEMIKLQRNMIQVQRTHIDAVRRGICEDVIEVVEEAVKEGVQDTLNASVKTYSDVAQSGNAATSSAALTQETLKKVVKQVAMEEELSRM